MSKLIKHTFKKNNFMAPSPMQSIISGWGTTSFGGSQPTDLKKVFLQVEYLPNINDTKSF